MVRLLAVIFTAVLANGCVYYHRWDRSGATEQDFYQDSMRCRGKCRMVVLLGFSV